MNTEDLRAALIHSLNMGEADHFMEALGSLSSIYEEGSIKTLEKALFMLDVNIRFMLLEFSRHQQEMLERRIEDATYSREEANRETVEDMILSGKFTDEEGDREALEERRHSPRR